MPDPKFESGSFSSFGAMMSQIFPLKRGTNHKIRIFAARNGFNFEKLNFYVQNRSFRPKVDSHVNFSNFQAEVNFFIFKIFGMSR